MNVSNDQTPRHKMQTLTKFQNSGKRQNDLTFGYWKLVIPWLLCLGSWNFSPIAAAATYDIKEMTSEVQQAISGRQNRYSDLQALKASGSVGENNQGYVELLKPAENADLLVRRENQDRKTIYRTIVSQNQLGAEGLGLVEKAFAEVQRDKARSGESIQTASGQWIKK